MGFIGLGNMGGHMARNLLKAGRPLVVYDVAPASVEALVGAGAKVSPRWGGGSRCTGSPIPHGVSFGPWEKPLDGRCWLDLGCACGVAENGLPVLTRRAPVVPTCRLLPPRPRWQHRQRPL